MSLSIYFLFSKFIGSFTIIDIYILNSPDNFFRNREQMSVTELPNFGQALLGHWTTEHISALLMGIQINVQLILFAKMVDGNKTAVLLKIACLLLFQLSFICRDGITKTPWRNYQCKFLGLNRPDRGFRVNCKTHKRECDTSGISI